MFRDMRRFKQELTNEECIKILDKGSSGVLAVLGDNDYPYAVPLSYACDGSKIYFHCAKEGHKIDAIRKCSKASFCVIGQDNVVPDKYTTYFRSVIAFGKAHIIDNTDEKRRAIEILAAKYTPDDEEGRLKEIDSSFDRLCMIELDIEHLSGKEAIELVRSRGAK